MNITAVCSECNASLDVSLNHATLSSSDTLECEITVEACRKCIDKERDEAYDNGYERGHKDAEFENEGE